MKKTTQQPDVPSNVFQRIAQDVRTDPELAALYLANNLQKGDREGFLEIFSLLASQDEATAGGILQFNNRKHRRTGSLIFDALSGDISEHLKACGLAISFTPIAPAPPPEKKHRNRIKHNKNPKADT